MAASTSLSAPSQALLLPYGVLANQIQPQEEASDTLKPPCCGRCGTTDITKLVATHLSSTYSTGLSLSDYHWTCIEDLQKELNRVHPGMEREGEDTTVTFNCPRCASSLQARLEIVKDRILTVVPPPVLDPSTRAPALSHTGPAASSAHRAYTRGAPVPLELMLGL